MPRGYGSNETVLEYRVTQLERRADRHEKQRHGRPVVIATVIIGSAAVVQAIAAVLLLTGRLHG